MVEKPKERLYLQLFESIAYLILCFYAFYTFIKNSHLFCIAVLCESQKEFTLVLCCCPYMRVGRNSEVRIGGRCVSLSSSGGL